MSRIRVSVCKFLVIKSELSQNIPPRLKTSTKEPHIKCLSPHSKFEAETSLLQIRSVRAVAAGTVLYLLSYKVLYARFLNSNSKFNKSKP
jgi:hypothetical protein